MNSKIRAKHDPSSSRAAKVEPTGLKKTLGLFSLSSPAQIWKSKISWRIATAVFLTIMLVQAVVLIFSRSNYETQELGALRAKAQSSILPLLEIEQAAMLESPIAADALNRLFATTPIKGLTIYGEGMTPGVAELIGSYGEQTVTVLLSTDDVSKTFRSSDGGTYEFVFRVSTIMSPYYIVVRMDSAKISQKLRQHVEQSIIIMLLLSALVTTVLMIALGYWLLEPILFMRNNLMAASKNPEDPKIKPSPFDPTDEIGGAIEIAQRLIEQNADNIKRIKSAAEDKIHKLAYYDSLTNLPNRTLFIQELTEKMRMGAAADNTERFAVVAIDLDHFKDINDSMGHNVGDAILRGVGKRLRSAMPEKAIVSRSGEDEFAIMMPLSTDINTSKDVADKVLSVIRSEPFKVFNEEFQVRVSVGAATFPDDGIDPDQVLKSADIALNRAKEEGRDKVKEYSEDFDKAVQYRFRMLRDLRDALEKGQLQLNYQPQLELKTGKLIGAEALLRWWKPDNSKSGGSFISPGEFIPVAEQSNLIVPIGEWVLQTACSDAKEWHDKYGYKGRVAINVSGAQFTQSDMVGFVNKTIKKSGIDPKFVELEVTESVFMDDINQTIQTLKDLNALGVELAIDDFGTGYSSLSYLRKFPIDRLKVDQSFIRNALNNPDDASITRTIITLGHSLNLKVIAEGVETIDHEKMLQQYNCDEVQGFRYSKPVPKDQFVEFIKNYTGDLSYFS